jgi:CubicO group peptidase (beta-lactamase class C family)
MKAPIRFSAGFMRGEKLWSMFGFNTAQAFGHLGFINILCWADPARDISVAFLNTGKSLAPEGFLGFVNVTRTISQAFPIIE